jgi:hypothetical protein
MSAIDWTTIMSAIRAWVVGGSGLPDTAVFWKDGKLARPTAPFIELGIIEIGQPAHDYISKELNIFTFTPITVVADVPGNRFTAVAHGMLTGDGPVRLTTTGTAPTPFVTATDYWIIKLDADHFRLANTFVHAMAATPLALTGAGTGTIQVVGNSTLRAGIEIKRTAKGIRECTLEMQCFAPEGSVHVAQQILTDVQAALTLYTQPLNIAGVGMSDVGVATTTSSVKILEGRRGSILEPRAICEMSFFADSSISDFTTFIQTVQVAITPQNVDGTALPVISEVIST